MISRKNLENERINAKSRTFKIFRETNLHCDLLTKKLFERNFHEKIVRVNFLNFHTVQIDLYYADLSRNDALKSKS